jgi:hypothetical protein
MQVEAGRANGLLHIRRPKPQRRVRLFSAPNAATLHDRHLRQRID